MSPGRLHRKGLSGGFAATSGRRKMASPDKEVSMQRKAKPLDGERKSVSAMLDSMSTEEIQKLIAEAAYYRAERRGFAPGGELGDWLDAEAEMKTPSRRTGDS
jgi:hypothetical protein